MIADCLRAVAEAVTIKTVLIIYFDCVRALVSLIEASITHRVI